jgi:hypothetical protein
MKNLYFTGKKYKIIFCFLIGLLFILNFETLFAREVSLEEAVQWGVLHNLDLQNLRYNIEDIQRNLEILEAGKSFQVDLSITPIWRFGGKDNSYLIEMEEDQFAPDTELSLSVNKILASNLTLSSEISWQSENFMDSFLESIANEVNASIKLNHKLYPNTWSEQEKQTYSLENNLKTKLDELKWTEVEKQIEFIQKYLNIIRLQEQLDIISEQVRQAEEELERVKAQIELGEGGYQQETEVVISLSDTKDKHWSLTSDLLQAKKQWYLLLNLPDEVTVKFDPDTVLIETLFTQMENLPISNQIHDILIAQALEENYQVQNSMLEKDELLKELQWTKDDGKPAVNISGGYSYPDSDWFVMLDFKVNLADGGAQKLKIKQKEENMKRKEISTIYLMEMIKLEAQQLLDKDEYNQLVLQTSLMSLEKEQERDKIIEQQYQKGAIGIIQRESNLLSLKEKELSLKQAYDQWLINRLKLAHFIGFLPKGV